MLLNMGFDDQPRNLNHEQLDTIFDTLDFGAMNDTDALKNFTFFTLQIKY